MNTVQHDFLTLIQTRRSVRAYKPDPVPADLLDAVLEAGTWAPPGEAVSRLPLWPSPTRLPAARSPR